MTRLRSAAIRDESGRVLEVVEYDPHGVVVARHYADTDDSDHEWKETSSAVTAPRDDVIYPTEDDDWIKGGTWDIRVIRDNVPKLVEDLDELWEYLGVAGDDPEDRRGSILGMMQLPAWTPAPDQVKAEAYAYLRGEYTVDPETKGLRRVRTPEGERHFGLPIGSPIVAKPDIPRGSRSASSGLGHTRVGPWADEVEREVRERYEDEGWEVDDAIAEMQSLVDGADVYVRVDQSVMLDVIEQGRLLNQFEAGNSSGLFDQDLRIQAEHQLFGLPNDVHGFPIYGYPAGFATRPSYGYLAVKPFPRHHNLQQYGDVAIQLKNGRRRDVTFTIGDSLDDSGIATQDDIARARVRGVYGDEDDPQAQAALAWARQNRFTPVSSPRPIEDVGIVGLDGLAPGDIEDAETINDIKARFVEAQIHGGFALEDVEAVYLVRDRVDEELIEMLEERGIRVVDVG